MGLSRKWLERHLFRFHKRSAVALALLIPAAFLGNCFSLSLFFGVDFLFGSIAVLVLLRLYGTGWGMLSAIIGSTYTVVLWNHPYAAIILIGEALFVGLLLRRQRQSLVLLDGLFWVLIGMPLVWLFYALVLHVDVTQTWLIMYKQAVNGIFNAVVASLILTCLPLHHWAERPKLSNTLSFQQTLLNLLVAFVFFPSLLLMVLNGHRVINDIETKIQAQINSTATDLVAELGTWHQQHLQALSALALVAARADTASVCDGKTTHLDLLQQSTELTQRSFPDLRRIYVGNAKGTTVASYPNTNEVGEPLTDFAPNDKALFQEIKTTLQPFISDIYIDAIAEPQQNRTSFIPHVDVIVPVLVDRRFFGFTDGVLNLNEIRQLLQSKTHAPRLAITLIDQRNRIIASNQPKQVAMQRFNQHKGGEIQYMEAEVYHWLPAKGKTPPIVRWKKSFYVKQVPLGGSIPWTLVLEAPAEPDVSYLQSLYINDLSIMLLIAVLALSIASYLSCRLVSPLSELTQVTTNLPHRLLEGEAIYWPSSSITEIGALVRNFKSMALTLEQKFQEIKRANETLEQRVFERTQELLKSNEQLETEIKERKRAEEELRESKLFAESVTEYSTSIIYVFDLDTMTIAYANHDVAEKLGYGLEDIQAMGKNFLATIIHPDDMPYMMRHLDEFKNVLDGEVIEFEQRVKYVSGEWRWLWNREVVFKRRSDGTPYQIMGTAQDITERKKANERLTLTLREKEVLLKEIHHRVKNNLQVIESLLRLQSRYTHDEHARLMFKESRDRIKSMALIHEKLYQSLDLARINFADYIQSLVASLFRSYNMNSSTITLKTDVADTLLSLDMAIPCGLIINELVSNSLKYAFTESNKGEIHICLRAEDEHKFILIVSDNGVGFPKDLDFRNTESLGLQLVTSLAEQLRATIELHSHFGTEFRLAFTEKQRSS